MWKLVFSQLFHLTAHTLHSQFLLGSVDDASEERFADEAEADEGGYRPASAAERLEAEHLKRQAALLSGLKASAAAADGQKGTGSGSGNGSGTGSGSGNGSGNGTGTGTGAVPPKSHELRRVLMQRVCDVDDHAALATLHLFDTLLQVCVCGCVCVCSVCVCVCVRRPLGQR